MAVIISGATILDGVSDRPIEGKSIWIEAGRIKAIAGLDELGDQPAAERIDATGKYIIPGLMNANVHLLADVRLENLLLHDGRYEDLIIEAAQVALKRGVTTVFDTWGPRRALIATRDRINAGEMQGSRIFCAGNIIGLDGPCSPDFFPKTLDVASPAIVERINTAWTDNAGAHLTAMTPEQVREEIRAYLGKGIDFVKYASSDHRTGSTPIFLVFSDAVQRVIVEEAHRAGTTAQAHSNTVESLRMAVAAGADLIQHGNFTGPTPIPESTFDMMVRGNTACVVFPITRRRLDWAVGCGEAYSNTVAEANRNVPGLIRAGVTVLLGTDGGLYAPEMASDPHWGKYMPGEDCLYDLDQGHIFWLKAMDELGLSPMESLKAATRNVAVAYGKGAELGTLEPGKTADLVILDHDPLMSPDHYRSVHRVIKDGVVVDHAALPLNPLLTAPRPVPSDDVLAYRASRRGFSIGHPICCG
nr:amidohydrolase family protein [Sphingomonas sp. Y57]